MIKDIRLGRRYEPDSRNDLFPVRPLLLRVAYQIPVSKVWDNLNVLDQGQEGSCVGHGFAGELLTTPYALPGVTHDDALQIYYKAQILDEYPGEDYEGTSVLAGVKALQSIYRGVESYRWATSINDMVAVLGYHGPIVIGVNWYEGMFDTDEVGFIHVDGQINGGHCVLVRGVDIEASTFLIQNSWGLGWGIKGCAFISFDDMARLLHEQGEACVVIHQEWWKKLPENKPTEV